jgi:hypothetical protein
MEHVWEGGILVGMWLERQKERSHYEDQEVDGRVILKCILKNMKGWFGLSSSGSGQGRMKGCYEQENEPSVFIKYWQLPEKLSK